MSSNKFFIEGPISPEMICENIAALNKKKYLGAYTIFCGQVRNDKKEDKEVMSINYSHYPKMAETVLQNLINSTLEALPVNEIIILHSVGEVKAGEISLMVIIAAGHRKACLEAQKQIIEAIKFEVPVWKKEMYEGGTFGWI